MREVNEMAWVATLEPCIVCLMTVCDKKSRPVVLQLDRWSTDTSLSYRRSTEEWDLTSHRRLCVGVMFKLGLEELVIIWQKDSGKEPWYQKACGIKVPCILQTTLGLHLSVRDSVGRELEMVSLHGLERIL